MVNLSDIPAGGLAMLGGVLRSQAAARDPTIPPTRFERWQCTAMRGARFVQQSAPPPVMLEGPTASVPPSPPSPCLVTVGEHAHYPRPCDTSQSPPCAKDQVAAQSFSCRPFLLLGCLCLLLLGYFLISYATIRGRHASTSAGSDSPWPRGGALYIPPLFVMIITLVIAYFPDGPTPAAQKYINAIFVAFLALAWHLVMRKWIDARNYSDPVACSVRQLLPVSIATAATCMAYLQSARGPNRFWMVIRFYMLGVSQIRFAAILALYLHGRIDAYPPGDLTLWQAVIMPSVQMLLSLTFTPGMRRRLARAVGVTQLIQEIPAVGPWLCCKRLLPGNDLAHRRASGGCHA